MDLEARNITILVSNPHESQIAELIKEFGLNPLFFWEVTLKQRYDKIVKFSDSDALFYNVTALKDFQTN